MQVFYFETDINKENLQPAKMFRMLRSTNSLTTPNLSDYYWQELLPLNDKIYQLSFFNLILKTDVDREKL